MHRLKTLVFKVERLLLLCCVFIIITLMAQHGLKISHFQLPFTFNKLLALLVLIMPVMIALFYPRLAKR